MRFITDDGQTFDIEPIEDEASDIGIEEAAQNEFEISAMLYLSVCSDETVRATLERVIASRCKGAN